MNRRVLCRPSLRISRSDDQTEAGRFRADVWNPFVHEYQPIDSVEDGVARVGQLANLIGRMWLGRHPKLNDLMDVPAAAENDVRHWAELRINATTFRSYDTRSDNRPIWARAAGMKQAATAICIGVGYLLQNEGTSSNLRLHSHTGTPAP